MAKKTEAKELVRKSIRRRKMEKNTGENTP